MPESSPTPTTQLSPLGEAAQQDGIVMTQMLIVADVERSVSFYRDVLGATVLREHSPAMLRFHNGWLVIKDRKSVV